MYADGQGPGPADGFSHQALVYGSDREFMDFALPFVEGGLSDGQPILAAVQSRHLEGLRSAFGGTPEGLTLHPVEDWYETSARSREKFAAWASERSARAGRVRMLGEPPWALGRQALVRDWARHESVLNVAFSSLPVTFVCPYDSTAIPGEVLEHAHRTHPEIVDAKGVIPSGSYEDPRDFCERLDSTVEVQGRQPALEMLFELGDLPAVRRLIAGFATDGGRSGARTEEVVLAVNEITTNAVLHGRPPTTVRGWHAAGEIILDVTDAGEGIRNALVGQLPPPTGSLGGRGIWLTRLLCDAVEVCDAGGCTVTLHAATPVAAG